jgi:hypothetical protein
MNQALGFDLKVGANIGSEQWAKPDVLFLFMLKNKPIHPQHPSQATPSIIASFYLSATSTSPSHIKTS